MASSPILLFLVLLPFNMFKMIAGCSGDEVYRTEKFTLLDWSVLLLRNLIPYRKTTKRKLGISIIFLRLAIINEKIVKNF